MNDQDQLQRFVFDNTDIRGEIVRIEQSYQQCLQNHQYTEVVANLLGEFMAAASLLSATLKFEGTLTLQARSDGQIPLIMAEATSDHKLRAIAKQAEQATSTDFHTLLTNGRLCIIIDPDNGQRYQGIVSLDGNSLAECLEAYFRQSEQLSTRIWLSSNQQQATGFMLQELPASESIKPELRLQQWEHLTHLANTLTEEELITLDFQQLLHRLYHEEQVRIFPAAKLEFKCSCSQTRTLNALRSLGQQELLEIIAEQGVIEMNCEFCHQYYHFEKADILTLFTPTVH
jgi:molecular chaperone Hsp33